MFWTDQPARLTGIMLLLLSLGIIIQVFSLMSISEADPFDRGEIQEYLTDINSHETEYICGVVVSIAMDSVIGIIAGILVWILFSDRNRVLALITAILLVASSIPLMVADALSISLLLVARDFVEGGPQSVDSGTSLEVGRALAMGLTALQQVTVTTLAVGLIGLGGIIGWSPAGAVNPPRWLGYPALLAGLAFLFSWTAVLVDAAFVLFIIGGLSGLIMQVILGIWLIRQRGDPTRPAAASM